MSEPNTFDKNITLAWTRDLVEHPGRATLRYKHFGDSIERVLAWHNETAEQWRKQSAAEHYKKLEEGDSNGAV